MTFILVSALVLQVRAQSDTNISASTDIFLEEQLKVGTDLIKTADSIRIADSLERAAVLEQIENLRARDDARKTALQNRLDSMQRAYEAQNARIKAQVDSLRANTPGVPVVIFRDTVFYIYSKLGPFSPSDRAGSIVHKVETIVRQRTYHPQKLVVANNEESSDLMHEDWIILSITDRDAFWLNSTRQAVAEKYSEELKQSIADYKKRTNVRRTLARVGILTGMLILLVLGIFFMSRGFTWLNKWVLHKGQRFIKGIHFKKYEILSREREEKLLAWLFNVLKWVTIFLFLYLALPIAFSIFPTTRGIAMKLIGYVIDPIKNMGIGILNFIPELITILVIIMVVRYLLRFLQSISLEIERGKLQIPGFYPDWAEPTYGLIRIIILVFTFIVIFPYLPGSDSPIFRGVSVFFGLLISLGSTAAIGNIIAGLVITYMRAFKIGDRVKIGDTTGDVIEKTMLVTRVRSIKNESITIPNAAILNGSTINYSTSARELGLILNTTITIGYDVPWRTVHEILIQAALKTNGILPDPKPFVLQTSLDDFYVSYQINAYTEIPGKSAVMYSELHANIQDGFNEAGLEILSPHYRAVRDGNIMAIPAEYFSPDYKPPVFNVGITRPEEPK